MPLLSCKLAGMADHTLHTLLHSFLVLHVPFCCTPYNALKVKEGEFESQMFVHVPVPLPVITVRIDFVL